MFIDILQQMKPKGRLGRLHTTFVIGLILIAAAMNAFAQSTDRDNPTRLGSEEIRSRFSQDDPEYFYSFWAGPGEVSFTLDVKGSLPSGGIPYFHLFSRNGKQIDTFDLFAARNATEKRVKRVSFAKRQFIVLRASKPIGEGSYRLRISGAVELAKEAAGR